MPTFFALIFFVVGYRADRLSQKHFLWLAFMAVSVGFYTIGLARTAAAKQGYVLDITAGRTIGVLLYAAAWIGAGLLLGAWIGSRRRLHKALKALPDD